MMELQVELNSWKICGRKLSHYDIILIEILKIHVYHPHVRPMEYADSSTHETYFTSCQICAHNSRDNHYSLLQVWWLSIIFTKFFNLFYYAPCRTWFRKYFFFLKEVGFISDGWLQRVHNLSSVTTVPVTSYIEVYTECWHTYLIWGEKWGGEV